jgi:FKBP-type peptidyl-prolyl cis-trans isomerase
MKARSIAILMGLLVVVGGCSNGGAQAGAKAGSHEPANGEEQTFYVLGLAMGRDMAHWSLTAGELASLQKGIADAANGVEHGLDLDSYQPRIQALVTSRREGAVQSRKQAGQDAADKAAAAAGARRTASGLVYRTLREGSGATPTAESTVKVHYEGKLTDGSLFDSSVQRGEPVEFPLGQVIPCWTEGLQKVKVGGRVELVCPSDIAYGDRGRPPTIPGGATLVFEVELLEVK